MTKFRPEDRLVKEVEQQIRDTGAALEATRKQSAVEQSFNLNPLRQAIEIDLGRARLEQSGLQARRDTLANQVCDYEMLLRRFETGSAMHDDLVRKVKSLEENYLLYSKKRDEAMLSDALDQRKIGNAVLVEPPTRSPLPSSPDRPRLLIIGLFFSTFAGLGSIVIGELLGLEPRPRRKAGDSRSLPAPPRWEAANSPAFT